MARLKFMMPPPLKIEIEAGVSFNCHNKSWERPFTVERTEVGTRVYYLCRFTTPDPTSISDHYEFNRFVAVVDKPSGFVEVQNLGQGKGQPEAPTDVVSLGNALLERLACPSCKALVRMRSKVIKRRVELVVRQYTCPACGFKDVDYCD